MKPIRVVLADENEIFREGLSELLKEQPRVEVVYQCSSMEGVVAEVRDARPDVVLVDTDSIRVQHSSTIEQIHSEMPGTRVAVLSDSEDRHSLVSMMKAGAKGYLLKNISVDRLVKSIDLIVEGEMVVSPPLGTHLISGISLEDGVPGEPDLSPRENDVLRLVGEGSTNEEIADRLMITENTVKVHVKNILGKLGLKNKQQAAAYAVQAGVVTVSLKGSTADPVLQTESAD